MARTKVTPQVQQRIVQLKNQSLTNRVVAVRLGLSEGIICQVIRKIGRWAKVSGGSG
jgi:hypothetical protein